MLKPKITSERRMIYMAGGEMPKLSESEVSDIKKKKEEKGPELDTKGLVDESNGVIDKYNEQLKILPDALKTELHDEIVKYFKASPGRYEKDKEKGLSSTEFGEYKTAMVAKVKELMKEYAPSEEDIAAMKKAKEESEAAGKAAEAVKPFDEKEVQESPGEITSLETLNTKFTEYNGWNQSLQKEGADVISAVETVQKAYAAYKKARDGIKAYKKFKGYLWPEDDKERIEMQKKVDEAKTKVDDAKKKFEDNKGKLKKYGEELGEASNKQKEGKVTERDEALKKVSEETEKTTEAKEKKEKQYNELTKRQQEMIAERDKLSGYAEEVSQSKDAAESRKATAEMKKGELTQFNEGLNGALKRIEESLKTPGLSVEDKQKLEQAKAEILGKQKEAGVGLSVCEQMLTTEGEKVQKLSEEDTAVANRTLALKSHLEQQVTPSIGALNTSIATLEDAKLKYATTEEQVTMHYEKALKIYDDVDASVDNAVLKNNLANEKLYGQLESSKKSLDSMDTKPPQGLMGAFEATIGVPLSMAGGGISAAGEFIMEQATWLSNSLEASRSEMSTFSYLAARIGVELISTPMGVAAGLLEMGGGIVNMVAHPIDTAKGLSTLVGLNPEVSAATAWKEMGKALISYEDFKHGRIGIGIGKIFTNIVTTVTGASAVSAGGKAAMATYKAATAAGKGVAKSMAKAAVTGAKVAVVTAGEEIGTGMKEVGKGIKNAPKAIGEAAKAAPGKMVEAAKAMPGKVVEVTKAAPGKAKAAAEFVGGSFKSVGEGMVDATKRIFSAEARENAKLTKAAKAEAKYADALEKGHPDYQKFQEKLQKMREENPGMKEADLRLKFAQEEPKLYTEGFAYEKNAKEFEKAQGIFEAEVKKGMNGDNLEKTESLLEKRKKAQEGMIETAIEFKKFNENIKKQDPKAVEAMKEFQDALASGDPQKVKAVYNKHLEYSGAFAYMEHSVQFEAAAEKVSMYKLTSELEGKAHRLEIVSVDQLDKIAADLNKRYTGLPKGETRILHQSNGYALALDKEGKVQKVKINPIPSSQIPKEIQSLDIKNITLDQVISLEAAMLREMKLKMIDPTVVTNAIRKGLIQPTDKLIAGMVQNFDKLGAPAFFELPGVSLTKKQQITLIDNIANSRDYYLLRELPFDHSNPAIIEEMGKAVDKMCGNVIGMNVAEDMILKGKAPMTEKMVASYLMDEGNISVLEYIIDKHELKFQNGLTKEMIKDQIRMAKDKFADAKHIKSYRAQTDSVAKEAAKTALRNEVATAIEKIKLGQSIEGDKMAKILLNLKERDPAGFEMLMQSDHARLVNTECFDSIISGNKIEHMSSDGQKISIYVGKKLGEGGMGIVFNGAYYTPGQKGLNFGAYKQPHAHTLPKFWLDEIEGAKLVATWDHPNIMKPLHLGPDFIIYETGEKATDLLAYLNDANTSAVDYLSAMREMMDGMKEYRKKGYFHGDLKEPNVLRFKVGVDAAGNDIYQVKIIDNTPTANDRYLSGGFAATPGYSVPGTEWLSRQRSLIYSGVTPEASSYALGASADPYALAKMMKHALNRYVPNWTAHPNLTKLVSDLRDPVISSNPSHLAHVQAEITELITDMLSGDIKVYGPPVVRQTFVDAKTVDIGAGSKTPVGSPPQFVSDISLPPVNKNKNAPQAKQASPQPISDLSMPTLVKPKPKKKSKAA